MNAAYFSTATAMGSCNSYSRFTITGDLLMIDMSSPSFFFLFGLTRHGQNTWRTEAFPVRWAGATATVSVATKWGRSSPVQCFARVQKQLLRHPQLQCSAQLRFVTKVNGRVNHSVNRVVHVSFTPSSHEFSQPCLGSTPRIAFAPRPGLPKLDYPAKGPTNWRR